MEITTFLLGVSFSLGSSLLGAFFGGSQRKPITQREVNRLETYDEPSSRYGEPIPMVYGKARVQGIYIAAQVPFDWERDDYFDGAAREWALTYIYYGNCGVMWCLQPEYRNGPNVVRIWMNKQIYYSDGNFSSELGEYWGRFAGITYTNNFDRTTPDPKLGFLGSNHIAFRRAIYTSFNRLRLNNSDGGLFNFRYPNMEAEINTHTNGSPKLGLIIRDLLLEAGYKNEEIDTTELDAIDVRGVIFLPGRLTDKLAPLQAAYFFEVVDTGAKLKFIRSYRSASAIAIPATDLAAREDSTSQGPLFEETETDPAELPTSVRILYNNSNDWYQAASAESFKIDFTGVENVQEINTGLSLTPEEATTIANRQLLVQWSRRKKYRFSVLNRYNFLEAGDVVEVELRGETPTVMQITRINTQPSGVLQIEAHSYDSSVWGLGWTVLTGYTNRAIAVAGVPINLGQLNVLVNSVTNADGSVVYVEGVDYTVNPATGTVTPIQGGGITGEVVINWQGSSQPPTNPNSTPIPTTLAAVSCPRPTDTEPAGVYVFADGDRPWTQATLWISDDGTNYRNGGPIYGGVFGTCNTILPSGTGTDNTSDLSVTVAETMTLPTQGRILVGSEILDYRSATQTASTATSKTYSLSQFTRALRGTDGTGHAASEKFFLLSGYKYASPATRTDVGNRRYFKALSPGQTLAQVTAISVAITYGSVDSQGGPTPDYQDTDFTVEPNSNNGVNTDLGLVNAILPDNPEDFTTVSFYDAAPNGSFSRNPLTIIPAEGQTVVGYERLILNFNYDAVTLIYRRDDMNWSVYDGQTTTIADTGGNSYARHLFFGF